MRYFVDESFPKSVGVFLASAGHVVVDVRDLSQTGADDQTIFRLAQENQAVLLTTDRDFFHTIPNLHTDHHGIIVVSLRQPNRRNIQERVVWFLEKFPETQYRNCVVQLRDRTYLVKRTPG